MEQSKYEKDQAIHALSKRGHKVDWEYHPVTFARLNFQVTIDRSKASNRDLGMCDFLAKQGVVVQLGR